MSNESVEVVEGLPRAYSGKSDRGCLPAIVRLRRTQARRAGKAAPTVGTTSSPEGWTAGGLIAEF